MGVATVRLQDGAVRTAEIHWYEARGIGSPPARHDPRTQTYSDPLPPRAGFPARLTSRIQHRPRRARAPERAGRARSLLPRLALVGHRLHRGLDRGLIAQVVVLERLEVAVQLVDERNAGGDVEPDDVPVRDLVEVLDEGPHAVAVGGDEHLLAGFDGGGDGTVPVGEEPRHGVL